MLIKLIVCRVPSQHRERFARGQRRWSILSGAPGFLGQLGGWNRDDPSQAVIVGLWRSDGAYANFMADMHDPIFEGGEQPGSYDAISVTLWDQLCDMPGMTAAIPTAIRVSGLIRLARCELLPNRRDHFVRAQHTIWNPGMGACDGILAGAFTQSRDRDDEFLVCTLWRSAADHQAYLAGPFTELRRRSEVEKDCASLTGYVVATVPDWSVWATPET